MQGVPNTQKSVTFGKKNKNMPILPDFERWQLFHTRCHLLSSNDFQGWHFEFYGFCENKADSIVVISLKLHHICYKLFATIISLLFFRFFCFKSPLYYRPYFHKILKIQSVTFENHLMTKGDTQYEKGVTFQNQVI